MDSPPQRWKPRNSDLVLEAREARTDPVTGVVRLRNGSNLFFGSLLSWGIFLLGALLLNKSSLHGSDRMTPTEVLVTGACLVASSVLAHVVLVRPFVTITQGRVQIRNPFRIYEFSLDQVKDTTDGIFGYLTIDVSSDRVRVMGLEESLSQTMAGGSIDRAVLKDSISRASKGTAPVAGEGSDDRPYAKRWALLDRWLIVLLLAWAMYALGFLL